MTYTVLDKTLKYNSNIIGKQLVGAFIGSTNKLLVGIGLTN